MPLRPLALVLCLALAAASTALPATRTISAGGVTTTWDDTGAVTALGDLTGRSAAGGAGLQFLVDCPAAADALAEGQWAGSAAVPELTGRLTRSGLTCRATFAASPQRLLITVHLTNPTDTLRLVQVQLALPCPAMATPNWRCFDGYEEQAAFTKLTARSGFAGLLPLIGACDDRSGLAVGIEPHEFHSWLSGSFDPATTPGQLIYAVRRVLDPHGSETATFVVYGFEGDWGPAMAVDHYYDLFPDCFYLRPGVDPRFALAGGYVHSGTTEPPLRWEESRRLHHGWQPNWAFRRTGDWMPKAGRWPAVAGDYQAYIKARHDEYVAAAPGNPVCHYVEPTQCEATLAEQEFADSILWNKNGPTPKFLYSVPVISGESCHHVFPAVKNGAPANSFMRSTLADIPALIGDLGASGIYIDNASGGMRHYGPDLTGLPGRAYDDDGRVYATSAAGTAAVADLAHSLDNGFGKAGVPTNGVGTYPIAFHTDASIQEGTPWERARNVAAMRRMLGGKSLCWWEDHLSNVLRWRAMTPAQIIEAMDANVTYCLLYGLRWGIMPAVHVQRGRAGLVRHMPLLIELVQAGWRPVVPVKTDPRLWVGRYGTGLGTFITLSNPTREPISTDVTLTTPPSWGRGVFAFARRHDASGPHTLRQTTRGRDSLLQLTLQPKEFAVLQAVAAVEAEAPVTIAAEERTGTQTWGATLQLSGGNPGFVLRQYQPHSWPAGSPARLTPGYCKLVSGGIQFTRALPEPTPVSWDACGPYAPRFNWDDFPFLADGKPAASLVISAKATPTEQRAASRLAAYFEYYLGRKATPVGGIDKLVNPDLRLPILRDTDALPKGRLIFLGAPATYPLLANALREAGATTWAAGQAGRVVLDHAGHLAIAGRSAADVEPMVMSVLEDLDKTYPVSWGLEKTDMWVKAGVAGREFTGKEQAPQVAVEPEPTGEITLPANNLLRNASFEEGEAAPSDWAFSSPNAGDHKCEFLASGREGKRSVFIPRGQYWSQLVKLQPGKQYRLTAWRRLAPRASFLLWWCGIRENGTEGGGQRLYEQCLPDNDLVPNFLPAEYFSQPDVWNRTEMSFTAPEYPQISIRLAGDSKVAVDAVSLVPLD